MKRAAAVLLLAAVAASPAGGGDPPAVKPPSKFELLPTAPGMAARLGEPVRGHPLSTASVAIGRDRIVTAGIDGYIHFWDRKSLEHRAVLVIDTTESLHRVRLSPAGDRIAWGGRNSMNVRELAPFTRPWKSETLTAPAESLPRSLAFDPEGKGVIWAEDRGVFRLPGGRCADATLVDVAVTTGPFHVLADGGAVWTTLPWRDAATPKFRPHAQDEVTALACTADGLIATGSKGGHFAVWTGAGFHEQARNPGAALTERFQGGQAGGPPILSLQFSAKGDLLTVCDERSVRVIDAKTGDERLHLVAGKQVTCAATADTHTQVVAGLEDGSAVVWDVGALDWKVSEPRRIGEDPPTIDWMRRAAAPDGERLHCWDRTGTIRVYATTGAAAGAELDVVRPSNGWSAIALAADGTAAVLGDGRSVRLERRPAGDVAWTVAVENKGPGAFSDDGKFVAISQEGSGVVVLDSADGKVVAKSSVTCGWWGAAGVLPRDGSDTPVGWLSADGNVRTVIDAKSSKTSESAVSRDGALGAVWDYEEGLVLYRNGAHGKSIQAPGGGWTGRVSRLALSDDGARVAVATSDGEVTVFDVEKKERIAEFRDPSGSLVSALTFLDGGRVASASLDGTAIVWDPKLLPR